VKLVSDDFRVFHWRHDSRISQSPIATAVRAVFTDTPPGKYADT